MIQYPTDPEFIAAMTDDELRTAYEPTTRQPSDKQANRLLAEIERRGLDI